MTKPYLRDFRAEATALLKTPGNWVVAGIETHLPWPKVDQVVTFGGRDFVMQAATESSEPSIAFNAQPYQLSLREAREQILRFASALAWRENSKIEVFSWVGGGLPHGVGKFRGRVIQDFFEPNGLPDTDNEIALCALAFYREGLSIGNPFFAFLSFYKTIATIHRKGTERGSWIKQALGKLHTDDAKKRIKELGHPDVDIGTYLYQEGRNAIAHAELESFINPDRVADHERIHKDIPVIQGLAAIAIEEGFSLYNRQRAKSILEGSVDGFRAALKPDQLDAVLSNAPIGENQQVDLPDRITLVARRGGSFFAFETMAVSELHQADGGFLAFFTNADKTIQVCLGVDIREDELRTDPIEGLAVRVDRSSRAGVEREILMLKFQRCVLINGRVEVWDEEINQLIACTKPYIPVNVTVNYQWYEEQIAELEKLLATLS